MKRMGALISAVLVGTGLFVYSVCLAICLGVMLCLSGQDAANAQKEDD